MNVIDSCLRKIRRHIPEPLLKAAFVPKDMRRLGIVISPDEAIVRDVIRQFVIPDIQPVGNYTEVDITNCRYEIDPNDQWARIYYLTDLATGGREIMAAHLAVTPVAGQAYTLPPAGSYLDGYNTGVMSATQRVVDSNSALPRISSAEVRVWGPDAIRIKDPGMFVYATKLMVKMAYSQELNEIKPAFHDIIANLALYATQQHIYNQMSFEMDAGFLEHGMEFGAFKNFVERYSDAGQMYEDTLPAAKRALIHNDDIGNSYNYKSGGRLQV